MISTKVHQLISAGKVSAGMLVIVLAVSTLSASVYAAPSGFYLDPASKSSKVGDKITISVRVNTGSECTNAVEANVKYPTNLLQYGSTDVTGSNFQVVAPSRNADGVVSLQQGSTNNCNGKGAGTGVNGDQLIGKVTFTVIATGTADLSFVDGSIAVSSEDNKTNVAKNTTGATYTLAAAPAGTPTPTPAPAPSQAPRPARGTPVTTFTPRGTETPIPLAENESIKVTTPVEIQPTPIQADGISKVEYYLDDKLMASVAASPYKYDLDTTKLLNGSYTLKTKTYYKNGQVRNVNQTVIVDNPFGLTQFVLLLKKYAGLILLLLLLIAAAVAVFIMRRRSSGGSPPPSDGNSGGGSYVVQDNPSTPNTVIVPSNENIRF